MVHGCGNCLFLGKSKVEKDGAIVLCLIDNQWHSDTYKCDNHRLYYEIPLTDRIELASALKNGMEEGTRHRQTLAVAKESNDISRSAKRAAWWAFWISIVSIAISLLVAIFKK